MGYTTRSRIRNASPPRPLPPAPTTDALPRPPLRTYPRERAPLPGGVHAVKGDVPREEEDAVRVVHVGEIPVRGAQLGGLGQRGEQTARHARVLCIGLFVCLFLRCVSECGAAHEFSNQSTPCRVSQTCSVYYGFSGYLDDEPHPS